MIVFEFLKTGVIELNAIVEKLWWGRFGLPLARKHRYGLWYRYEHGVMSNS